MQIENYNFLFHPFHENHSVKTAISSVITNIFLTVVSCGAWIAAFGFVHLKEIVCAPANPNHPGIAKVHIVAAKNLPQSSPSLPKKGFVNIPELIKKQHDHLQKLQALASLGQWQHIQTHTSHPDSGFDWWMFPINRRSNGYGTHYQLNQEDIEYLKKDPVFMKNYRDGVILVAKSWGWDLETNRDVTSATQHWANWDIRLAKMLRSLELFGETDLRATLWNFVPSDLRARVSKIDL